MGWVQERLTAADPRKLALHDESDALSYRELAVQLASRQEQLRSIGVVNGQTVALIVEQTLPAVVLLLSLLAMQVRLLPLDPLLTPEERQRIGRLAGVDLWIVPDSDVLAALPALKSDRQLLTYREISATPVHASLGRNVHSQLRPHPYMLLLTSGTSGPLKAARIPYHTLWRGAEKYVRWFSLSNRDRVHAAVPFFHSFGLIGALLATLAAGGSLYVNRHPSPRRIAETVKRHDCTVLYAVPQQYMWLAQSEMIPAALLNSLSLSICSGGSLNDAVAKAFYDKFGKRILQVYGSTETGAIAAHHPLVQDRTGATGFLLPAVDVTTKADGRLEVVSDTLFAGYLGGPLRGMRAERFLTGDIGTAKEGRVYLRGRVSQYVNLGGRKVNLAEVREALVGHVNVKDAHVIGKPDPHAGEKIVAYLTVAGRLDAAELRRYLAQRLAPYKIPQEYYFVDELPRTWKTSVGLVEGKEETDGRKQGN